MTKSIISNVETPPTPEAFYLSEGLYNRIALGELGAEGVLRIEYFEKSLDTYCILCGRDSVFTSQVSFPATAQMRPPYSVEKLLQLDQISNGIRNLPVHEFAFRERVFQSRFVCSRNVEHFLIFYAQVGDISLQKIGQYPSVADIHLGTLKSYRRVLPKEQAREFSKAVGLYAHGIGAGSFVYLRRVFEHFIEEAHAVAMGSPTWIEDNFATLRMDEKVLALKDYLPKQLVENRRIYAILSKGIHTLGEEECLRYFSAVRASIELILQEKLEKIEREEREVNIKK